MLLSQLPESRSAGPLFGSVQIVVMNMAAGAHAEFDALKALYATPSHPKGSYLTFLENKAPYADAQPGLRDGGSADRPGWKVRKQTRDTVRLLESVKGVSRYHLFVEDDMRLCPYGFSALRCVRVFCECAARRLGFVQPLRLFTVTFHANPANDLTCPPSHIII